MALLQKEKPSPAADGRETLALDKDCVDFLIADCFPSEPVSYDRAYRKAYLDLCRTLGRPGKKLPDMTGHLAAVEGMLDKNIKNLTEQAKTGRLTQEDYDGWHRRLCEEITGYFKAVTDTFTFGHAQKWVNMSMKYLYVLDSAAILPVFAFLHVPVDGIVMDKAKKDFKIKPSFAAWSKIPDYDTYFTYQKQLRDRIKSETGLAPLRWEFQIWNNR